ncbi:MAG TPA: carboxypeptidase-like regulatory domain-containing protein [Longimicrobiales bacterium]|nr:carboxypeptidase-like regulatory domain-containing protein [Longimicrobiales bacterium]
MRTHSIMVAVVLLTSVSAPSPAQVISGRLFERDSNRPVNAAWVSLVGRGRILHAAESDAEGRFRLLVAAPGWYSLRVERLGYALVSTDTFAIGAGESAELSIPLSVAAVPLTPVIVDRRTTVQARSELDTRIETARRTGLGRFVTREALDSVSSRSVTGVLVHVPLVGLARDAFNKPWPITQSQGNCRPTLYLNGARMTFGPGQSIDDVLHPSELEAIEIYRNRTELPREFAGIDQCAAIVFWTRMGESTSSSSWRFLAATLAVVGMVMFFLVR